ncbi:MAG: YraN family protein [Bacteroidota bacterium]
MAEHNELGEKGEILAAELLEKKGYRILDKNWRFGKLELDIIAHNGENIVIIEVKSRETGIFGDPALAVTRKKQRQIVKAAHAYIIERDIEDEARFDIISVIMAPGHSPVVEHIESAFYPLA